MMVAKEIHAYRNEDGTYRIEIVSETENSADNRLIVNRVSRVAIRRAGVWEDLSFEFEVLADPMK